jgi:hypothetical protein
MPIIPRKSRPYRFPVTPAYALAREVAKIVDSGRGEPRIEPEVPGIIVNDEGVWCGRDSVEIVSRYLNIPITQDEIRQQQYIVEGDWPGLQEYERRFAKDAWPHQPAGGAFLAARSAAFQCDPARTGKNTAVLMASVLVGARQTVIATNGTPKLGWAEDIIKWFGESPLILEGRKGTDAWEMCVPCKGRGIIEVSGKFEKCPACRTGRGMRIGGWVRPQGGVEAALAQARFVVVNYDILIPQKVSGDFGEVTIRQDLKGWVGKITKHTKFDVLVCDELQKVGDKGNRLGALRYLSRNAPRVYAPTATPTDGRIIKLYAPLDIVTGGMFGRSRKKFAARYAEGFMGNHGFTVPQDGCSAFAKTELYERLNHLWIKRTDAEINPLLPPIRRQTVRINAPTTTDMVMSQQSKDAMESSLNATASVKIPTVVADAIAAMEEGKKVCVYSRERATGIAIHNQIVKVYNTKAGDEMRAQRTELWCCIGKTSDTRVTMAKAFSAHTGAACFTATIDGFQTGVSLGGVNFNLYADLHWSADAINQTERRSMLYERRTGLVSVFYLVAGTSDDDVVAVLLPKLETLEVVLRDGVAGEYRELLSEKETLEQIFARHMAR